MRYEWGKSKEPNVCALVSTCGQHRVGAPARLLQLLFACASIAPSPRVRRSHPVRPCALWLIFLVLLYSCTFLCCCLVTIACAFLIATVGRRPVAVAFAASAATAALCFPFRYHSMYDLRLRLSVVATGHVQHGHVSMYVL